MIFFPNKKKKHDKNIKVSLVNYAFKNSLVILLCWKKSKMAKKFVRQVNCSYFFISCYRKGQEYQSDWKIDFTTQNLRSA